MEKSRASAVAALVIIGPAIVYIGLSIAGWEPSVGWLIQAVIHVGELLAVVALALSGVGWGNRAAGVGLAAAIIGQVVIAVAEVIWPGSPDLADVLFAISPILTGAGLITAGVGILRTRRWSGPARLLPLTLGLYTLFVLIPLIIGSGGPPAPLALAGIGGWDLLWFALGASLLSGGRAKPGATAS